MALPKAYQSDLIAMGKNNLRKVQGRVGGRLGPKNHEEREAQIAEAKRRLAHYEGPNWAEEFEET